MSQMYQAGRSSQLPLPRRRSWASRHKLRLTFAAIALALIAAGVMRAWPSSPAASDYRDPVQLAQAVKDSEASKTGTAPAAVSCAKNTYTGKYMCFAAYTGGASASYTVTVSPDGRSWSAS